MQLARLLIFSALTTTIAMPTAAVLKRNTEKVDVPRYCERLFVEFERKKILYPIPLSGIEALTGREVTYSSGRCILTMSYRYDAQALAESYALQNGIEDVEGYVKDFQDGEGLEGLKQEWTSILRRRAAATTPPHRFSIQFVYQPLQPSFPAFRFVFHGEDI